MKNQRKASVSRSSQSGMREKPWRQGYENRINARHQGNHPARSQNDLFDNEAYPNPNRCIE